MNAIKFQFITHFTDHYSYFDSTRLALEGGCRWIQLRMKDAPIKVVEVEAVRVMQLCREYGATFIIDDHVELVKKLGADGVHLGKNDMPIADARKILGKDCIIGGTANTFDDVCTHVNSGADYIGMGPFRYTTTKKNLSPVLGLQGYKGILGQMAAKGISVPVVAIGGITADDIEDVMQTGVSGIALSGTILRATDPVSETRQILQKIDNNNTY